MATAPRASVIASLVLAAIAACGGTTTSSTDNDASAQACVPGQSIACVAPGGCAGGQVCNASGSGFGGCVCGAVDASLFDSSMTDGPSSDVTAGDAMTIDSSIHDAARSDGSITDAGTTDATRDAAICQPGDVSTFMPPAYHHADRQVGACTSAQIAGFYTACYDVGHTMAGCNAFKASAPACSACIESPTTATQWGAVVVHNGVYSINIAGCMELTDGNAGLACAMKTEASEACDGAACDANCPVTDDASFQLYLACIQQASMNGCSSYYQAAQMCETMEADGGAAACLNGQDFQSFYNSIAPIFCGGTIADAGPG